MADELTLSTIESAELTAFDDTTVDEPSSTDNDALIEAALSAEIDPEELAAKEGKLALESGTYRWNKVKVGDTEEVKVEIELRTMFSETDKRATDIAQRLRAQGRITDDKGRCIHNISGTAINVQTSKKGRFQFAMSPDERLTEQGEPDFMSANYARFSSYFFKKMDRKPKSDKEILDFIRKAAYGMYITRGKDMRNYLNQVKDL